MSEKPKTEMFAVKDLRFDYSNPRLKEYDITDATTEEEIIAVLWDAMDVKELVQSIAASGFFPHEALIVATENKEKVVIEGNRRLAALKILLNPAIPQKYGWETPKISRKAKEDLEQVPGIASSRKDSWRYLGFKHVNGPAKWSSFAKAAYIGVVHRDYKVPLVEIAHQIGDQHRTVQRLYRGLMVLEQAEREGVYDREDRYRPRLAFSHLYTGLDYDGVISFLDLSPKEAETSDPVPPHKIKELGEFLVWLYGSKKERRPPVVQTQNPDLRLLNAVIGNREAVAALRAGEDLNQAYQISRPSDAVFEESLIAAKRELTTARGSLTTGYDNSEALLKIAGSIANMAEDIYNEMERKYRGGERQKRLTE